jgi:hypothetical protein
MSHARSQIRAAIAQMLTGLELTEGRVFPSRIFSLDESQLPSISVFTTEEAVTRISLNKPPRVHRDVTVVIEGHAMVDESVDETLDELASQIEQAMSVEIQASGVVIPASFKSTVTEFSDEGEQQIGVVRLTYVASYSTLETTPQTL